LEAGGSARAHAPDTRLPEGLATLLSAFPRGDIKEVVPSHLGMSFPSGGDTQPSSPLPLEQSLRELLDAAAREDGTPEALEIAFIVDMSFHADVAQAAQELELALAKNRPKLARVRVGLVATGNFGGQWSARIDVPLNHDSYDIQRALRKLEYEQQWAKGAGTGASWEGLVAATRLDWRSRHPRIVLLTDARPPGNERAEERDRQIQQSTQSPEQLVSGWAQRSNATLHALRCRYTDEDNEEYFARAQSDVLPRPQYPLDLIANLFRNGHHVEVAQASELVAALKETFARLARTPEQPDHPGLDVALLLDSSWSMRSVLRDLAAGRVTLDRFVRTPGHRLALIQYGKGEPSVLVNLTSKSGVTPNAIARLSTSEKGPSEHADFFPALDLAHRSLEWGTARASFIVLSATQTSTGHARHRDWTDRSDDITILDPAPLITDLAQQAGLRSRSR
jgi:hypothetical protein